MARLLRGLGSLAVLLLGTVGVPVALAFLGGNPLPEELTWGAVQRALFTPADDMILVGLITIIGWLAWLVFTLSVVSELLAIVSQQRVRIRLPGFDAPQRFAAGLLISVITMISVPQAVHADRDHGRQVGAALTAAEPAVLIMEPADASIPTAAASPRTERVDHVRHHHVVQPGDDLWSLAERYYGDGRDWRKIAAANPTVLTGGPDRLQVGWRLRIPDLDEGLVRDGQRFVTVRRGDTLSSIAEAELGASSRWTEIFKANRAQLSDPDELAVGMRLVIPRAKKPEAKTTPKAHDQRRRPKASPPEQPPVSPPVPSTSSVQPSERYPAPTTDTAPTVDVSTELLAGIGGLLAAGLIGGLAWRRRIQLQARAPGRRIVHPPPPVRAVEVALGQRQRPMSLRTLDRAMRAIAAHCKDSDLAPPPLQLALIGEHEIELRMHEACSEAPVGFTARGTSWFLGQDDVEYLKSVPGLSEAARPWPALVTLGRDDQGRLVVGDLESFGLLELQPDSGFPATDLLAAMAIELSFSPWADEMILTMVGGGERLPEALGKHNVVRTDDCDALLDRLEQRAAVQREHRRHSVLSQHRVDLDLADPWAPEIILVEQALTAAQSTRLGALIDAEPKVALAAVVVGPVPHATWSLGSDGSAARRVVLQPAGLSLSPQWLEPSELTAVVDLIETTGSDHTTPAPWWSDIGVQPNPPPDNVTYLESRSTWGTPGTAERALIMEAAMDPDRAVHHPTLQLLGPIELLGATGTVPTRAAKQCLEYCAWLLENPGTTAQAMVSALAVAEGTRRSNMSRLRSWLGVTPDGEAYLPDAYTGRIALHPAVSSDWQRLQILTATGVNRASDESLQAALELVRGAPLADAAPGQWHWAEELRTDMISCVRDIGVELADRALLVGNLEQARWAASRALLAAPGDELLLAVRIRTEHAAGNAAETERLTLQLAAQARTLGVDLDPATVSLLQQVMEGQVRARLA
ncbi:MAG TPA: LysM peptidoglycan-binding domain-containing protein [Propionibacteriaceae bacterium]|nr:LysM peptidoglycan-binding domain-containing protein [Propionibacteriaceae bacterium]